MMTIWLIVLSGRSYWYYCIFIISQAHKNIFINFKFLNLKRKFLIKKRSMCVEQENNKLFLNHCSVSRRHVSKNSHYLTWPLAKTYLSWHVLAFVCLGKCLQTEEWIKKLYMYIHSRILLLLLLSLFGRVQLCNSIDGSPPGSPVPGILQARTLEWVAISFSNAQKWKVKVKPLSCVWLFAIPWTAAYQAPPPMGFSRQEYYSVINNNKITPFEATWIQLEIIILSKVSQKGKDKYCMISLICGT